MLIILPLPLLLLQDPRLAQTGAHRVPPVVVHIRLRVAAQPEKYQDRCEVATAANNFESGFHVESTIQRTSVMN